MLFFVKEHTLVMLHHKLVIIRPLEDLASSVVIRTRSSDTAHIFCSGGKCFIIIMLYCTVLPLNADSL